MRRLDEQAMKCEGLEVHRRVHEARALEQGDEAGRDRQRLTVAERPDARERGAGEEDVAERAGMDDETASAHADTRLRGAVPVLRALQRGAT